MRVSTGIFIVGSAAHPRAVNPGARMLRIALSPAIGGRREDPATVEVPLNPDGRLRIESLAGARQGAPSRSAGPRADDIRQLELQMVDRRFGRITLSNVVSQFTPNWFSVTMGTGVLALALNQIPLRIPGIHDLAGGLWLLDIVLFVLFTVIYAARWVFFFDDARRIFWDPVVSMFLGAIPMGLATIINGLVVFDGGNRRSASPMRSGGATSRCPSPVAFWSHSLCSPSKITVWRK
jgi:Voltage-dependent anion channel